MTPNELVKFYLLARTIDWRHQLESLDGAAVAELIKNLKAANNQLRLRIEAELPQVWASYTADKGGAAVRLWLGEILTDPATQLENTITESWSISAQQSLAAYNDILSFGGMAKNIATIPITLEAITGLVSKKLFAGYTLPQLVGKAFTEGQIASVVQALDTGIQNGWSYPKVIKNLKKTALDEGLQVTQREAITLTRSYIQQASVNAQLAVYENNKEVVKGVEWCSILDNRVCRLCAATDGILYTFEEEKPPMPRHPRCFLPNTRVYAPDAIAAFMAVYDGPAYNFELENGVYFSCTANHPILTNRGFVPAFQIEDDTLIYCNDMLQGKGKTIKEIWFDWVCYWGAEKIESNSASLHGDGYFTEDHVYLAQNPYKVHAKHDERVELYDLLHCGESQKSVYERLLDNLELLKWWGKRKSYLSLQRYKKKERIWYQGRVYDLQTLSTLYYADRAIVSNCRCLWLPWVKSWRDLGIDKDDLERAARPWLIREPGAINEGGTRKVEKFGTTQENYGGWWATLDFKQQAQSIGPIRTKLINSGQLTWKDLMNRNTGQFYTLEQLGFTEGGKPLTK